MPNSGRIKSRVSLWFAVVGLVAALASVTWTSVKAVSTSHETRRLAQQLQRESRARVNQSCTLLDRRYRQRVASLELTYQYLLALKPGEKNSTFNRLIRNQLPATERDTQAERPAAFCDAKGVGLPGKNPSLPKRPASLK